MARARNLKPGFFLNEDLVELPFEYRLLFAGLWTLADREGRLEDRPAKIKMAIFPADNVDVNSGLDALADSNLIQRYVVDNKRYIQITGFLKHQNPHVREVASVIPAPDKPGTSTVPAGPLTSSLNPDSLSSESPHTETRVCVSDEEREHFDLVMDGLRERYKVNSIRDEAGWCEAIRWAYENNFSAERFLLCFDLMTKQKWRGGRITGKNVADNLPELDRMQRDVSTNGGKPKVDMSIGARDPTAAPVAVSDPPSDGFCAFCHREGGLCHEHGREAA